MDRVLFTLGDVGVTLAEALTGLGALLGLTLIVLLIGSSRAGRKRAEQAARTAAGNLRANFLEQVAQRDQRIAGLEAQMGRLRGTNADLQSTAAALEAQMGEQTRQAEQNLTRFRQIRQQMTDEFKALAGDVLKSHGETFSRQNREQVDTLLKPLSEKIVEFQSGLRKDRAEMGERIRALVESNQVITAEANNLTRALKGSSQTQGAWGEMILSSILERSGLREGEQFFTQQSHGADNGGRVRTDVEVVMPNGDKMIIDSKVSLTAFEAFTNAGNDDDREQHLQAHGTSMRTHIKTLGAKEYQRHAKSGLDFVLMFVPIEAAFSAALSAEPDLIDYGIDLGVLVTTPTTLMSALRTVRNVWDIEKRHQNAEQIAERAGSLYEKVAGFLGNMDRLGQNLGKAQMSFDEAKGQLTTGRGSVVRQVEMLRELGAKTSRRIPAGWHAEAKPGAPAQLTPADGPDEEEDDPARA